VIWLYIQGMTRCRLCESVHRKGRGESWDNMMCKTCYILLDNFTWSNRWGIVKTYLSTKDFLIDAQLIEK